MASLSAWLTEVQWLSRHLSNAPRERVLIDVIAPTVWFVVYEVGHCMRHFFLSSRGTGEERLTTQPTGNDHVSVLVITLEAQHDGERLSCLHQRVWIKPFAVYHWLNENHLPIKFSSLPRSHLYSKWCFTLVGHHSEPTMSVDVNV